MKTVTLCGCMRFQTEMRRIAFDLEVERGWNVLQCVYNVDGREVTDEARAVENNKEEKENTTMTKTMNIEGMMCMHCEATVKKALEKLEGVTEAKVSHEAGTAVVEMSTEVADDVLKKAVEDKDYTVTGIA